MRRKRVWRYYCDHCKKSGCHAGHMRDHEERCIRNPNRICRMHPLVDPDGEQASKAELTAAALVGVEDLRRVANGCPVCMLVGAMAASDLKAPEFYWPDGFNFKEERQAVWDTLNQSREENCAW